MRWLTTIALAACLCLAAFVASAERRVALVIGNDNYTYLPKLKNAGKDARDMAAKLKDLGFEVIASYNASQRNMGRAIGKFSAKLSAGGTGLVFYAGHGVQANGRNYLIPVNAELEDENDLEYGAIAANKIMEAMRDAGNPLNILIMDACRDNPLPKRTRSSSRGLAISSIPQGAKGTAIIYAAGPGQTAANGSVGDNGIFTGALLKYMGKPGWSLQKVLQATSRDVLNRTNNKQRPWQLVSMQGEFLFRAKPKEQKLAKPSKDLRMQFELTYWNSVKDSGNQTDLASYLQRYPTGTFAALAQSRIAALQAKGRQSETDAKQKADRAALARKEAAIKRARSQEKELWQTALAANDAAMLRAFLGQYPNSLYIGLAKAKIESLARQANRTAPVATQNSASKKKKVGNRRPTKTKTASIVLPLTPQEVGKLNGNWSGSTDVCGTDDYAGGEKHYQLEMNLKGASYEIMVATEEWGSRVVLGQSKGMLQKLVQQDFSIGRDYRMKLSYSISDKKFFGTFFGPNNNECPIILRK